MSAENDCTKFMKWAVSLGCPFENLPNEDNLKRIFRSNQNQNLLEMMRKIRPQSEVKHIRDNIIIKKIRKVDGQINTLVPTSLPPALQRYIHLENLKLKIEHKRKLIKQHKFQIEKLSKPIENENRNYLETKRNFDLSIQRLYIIENNTDFFIKHLKNLNEKKMSVDNILSYNKQIIGNDHTDQNVENDKLLINQCVEYLYNNNMEQYDQSIISHLKQILNSITNINKWNIINTLSNDQIKLIKSLSDKPKFKNDNFRYTILLSKLYAAHIKVELKLKKTNNDYDHFNDMFEVQFTNTEKIIANKFEMFNSSILGLNQNINRNEFILNFMEGVVTKYIQLDAIRFLNLQIDIINNEIEQYENMHMENQNNIQTFDLIYNNVMKSIDNIKKNSINIASTNGKLIYSKKVADSLMNEVFKNNNKFRKMIINEKFLTNVAMESFYEDSLLCSTKIGCDLDNMSRMETTTLPTNTNVQYNFIQSQLTEYHLFNKLPFTRISYIPSKFSIFIESNHILNHSMNDIYKKMFKNHLNTGNEIFDCVARKLELYDLLKCYTSKRIDFEMPFDEKSNGEINETEIQTKLNEQNENLKIIMNHIDGMIVNLNTKNDENNVILKLLLENEFKKYVPVTEQVNGHTYKQLENELKVYSRINKNT